MSDTLLLGAVAYDPKVVTIWEGFKAFRGHGSPSTTSSTRTTRRQVEAHFAGHSMSRGTRRSPGSSRAPRAPGGPQVERDRDARHRLRSDQRGRRARRFADPVHRATCAARASGVGASDSPQATLIPLFI